MFSQMCGGLWIRYQQYIWEKKDFKTVDEDINSFNSNIAKKNENAQ